MDMITLVSAEVPQKSAQAVSDYMAEHLVFASTWEDMEGGPSRVEIFLEDPSLAEDAAAVLVAAGKALSLDLVPETTTLKAEDWSQSWKRHFKVEKISSHLVVRPPWEEYAPAECENVIELNPGLSFGTGRHETTRTCMRILDDLAQANAVRDVLDIGTGSGILSIAAAKLGFRDVRGIDNDPDAVRIAAENAAVNGVVANFSECDLAKCELKADVVVANVLACVLIQFAEPVASTVRQGPNGALILSGILDTQYADVRAAYEKLGFREIRSVQDGEWRSGLFARAL